MTELSEEAKAFVEGLESELILECQDKFQGKNYHDPEVRAEIREYAMRKLWDYGREFTGCIPKVTLRQDDEGSLQIVLEVEFPEGNEE